MTMSNKQDALFDSIDRRLFSGNLQEKLKRQDFRRKVVKLGFILPVLLGYLMTMVVWMFLAPNPASVTEKLLMALFFVAVVFTGLISNVLDAVVRSVTPHDGEIYDERQNIEHLQARSDAAGYIGGMFVGLLIVGLTILIMIASGKLAFAYPTYSGIHYFVGIGFAGLIAISLLPGMLLAWRLPDMIDDDIDDDKDDRGGSDDK